MSVQFQKRRIEEIKSQGYPLYAVLFKLYQNLNMQIPSITIDTARKIKVEVHAHALGCACFFYNLYTCALGMGNQVSGMLGIEPPSIHEYFFSAQ